VAEQLTATDVLRAHARDELGIDLDELANPLQVRLARQRLRGQQPECACWCHCARCAQQALLCITSNGCLTDCVLLLCAAFHGTSTSPNLMTQPISVAVRCLYIRLHMLTRCFTACLPAAVLAAGQPHVSARILPGGRHATGCRQLHT
jgi:hypothetical protein